MSAESIRQLKIKTGVVKRLAKEVQLYKEELSQQEQKISQMRQQGADEYDIKKQCEVLQECKMMVPDCQQRLVVAHRNLQQFLEKEEHELDGLEEYNTAKTLLQGVELEQ